MAGSELSPGVTIRRGAVFKKGDSKKDRGGSCPVEALIVDVESELKFISREIEILKRKKEQGSPAQRCCSQIFWFVQQGLEDL